MDDVDIYRIGVIVFVLVGVASIGNVIGYRNGFTAGLDQMREGAVSQGVAEWTADESGKPVFTWKVCK